MSSQVVDVCLCCDHHAVDGLMAVLASAARHLRQGAQLHAHLLDCGLGEELAKTVETTVREKLGNVRLDRMALERERLDIFPDPTGLKHPTKATYAKLLLHELYPSLDRVIYLDCDILVQADLAALAEIPMEGACVAAVRDSSVENLHSPMETLRDQLPTLPADAPYFNAGVLKLDFAQLRARGMTDVFRQTAGSLAAHFGDQSIWNVVFANDWRRLPDSWNLQTFLLPSFNVFPTRRSCIWHFIRDRKPWHFAPDSASGIVAQWGRELKRIGWTPRTQPTLRIEEPSTRTWAKWLKARVQYALASS